jgi:thiosulfate dehydrogenase
MRLLLLCSLAALLAGCGDDKVPAAEFGQDRFADHKVSTSHFNTFSCATCHVVDPAAPSVVPGRLDSGYNLAGAATRTSWWGGGSTTLLDAINVCVTEFMGGAALAKDSDAARQLDAYLEGPPVMTGPAKYTFVRITTPLAELKGDATRGAEAYQKACHRCHGDAHTWQGHTTSAATVIPESSITTFGMDLARSVTVEKVRHGLFINIGGVMPFYTQEAMSDQTVADILVYMGL